MADLKWLQDFLNANAAQSALVAAGKTGGALAPDENSPQPTGPVGQPSRNITGPTGGAAYYLGQGLHAGTVGGAQTNTGAQVDSPYKRFAVSRGGKLVEAHDYGDGDVRFFARKNPALLDAAAKASLARGGGGAAQQQQQAAIAAMPQADQERIRRLLGV